MMNEFRRTCKAMKGHKRQNKKKNIKNKKM